MMIKPMERTMTNIPQIDVKTLKQWLDKHEVHLIDVREQEEYDTAHIEGAMLMPLSMFAAADIKVLEHKKIVFQCKSGGRSAQACQIYMQFHKDTEAYNLEGGIQDWISEGLPIITPRAS